MRDIKDILKKGKFSIQKTAVLVIISTIIAILINVILSNWYINNSLDRILIITCSLTFAGLHLIYKLKDMYNFIYKKRYYIALITFVFLVIMEYSGSSVGMYNKYVQKNNTSDNLVLGVNRSIRSDEWAVNTPLIFSQNKIDNKFSYFNENIRATNTDMFTIINAPVKDIVSIGKPFNIGYMLFGNAKGMSFWWFGRLIVLLLVSFELCMIISKKNKLVSLCGMLLITFSSATMWWYSNFIADILIFGQLAIVLIDKFMTTKQSHVKYLCTAGLIVSGISYIFAFYPPWQISFGYVFLALLIWIVLKNKKGYKPNIRDGILLALFMLVVGIICFRYFSISKDVLTAVMSTDYPGERNEIGGNAIKNTFSYVYNFLMPYKSIGNPSEASSMLSFFPIPFIIGIIYMIRKKEYKFLLPTSVITALLTIWTGIATNTIFAKITMLSMVQPSRAVIALGLVQIYVLIYILSKVDFKILNIKKVYIALISIVSTILVLLAAKTVMPVGYLNYVTGGIAAIAIFSIIYLLLNLDKSRNKNILIGILISFVLIGGITVNPIVRGVGAIYAKPASKIIQELTKNNNDVWLVDNMPFLVSNFLVANGAKTITSTNYYPNFEFWKVVLGDKYEENMNIFNRYLHIKTKLVNNDTNIALEAADSAILELNYKKLQELNVKYIASDRDLTIFSDESIVFKQVYSEDDFNIFEIK